MSGDELPPPVAFLNRDATLDSEEFSAMVAAVTSAFGDPTRRDIYLYARSGAGVAPTGVAPTGVTPTGVTPTGVTAAGVTPTGVTPTGVTAAEVAERFALHPNVARHHLDKLAAGGYLEVVRPHSEAGTGGRPSKHYRASAGAHVPLAFPPRRDDLLVMLLAEALQLLDPERAETMAESVGEEYGRTLASQLSPDERQRSVSSALSAVADALTAHGFAAHAEARGSSLAVVANNCPFGGAATVHPVLCAVDRGMVRGMLAGLHGSPIPVTMSSRARGDDSCTAVV